MRYVTKRLLFKHVFCPTAFTSADNWTSSTALHFTFEDFTGHSAPRRSYGHYMALLLSLAPSAHEKSKHFFLLPLVLYLQSLSLY